MQYFQAMEKNREGRGNSFSEPFSVWWIQPQGTDMLLILQNSKKEYIEVKKKKKKERKNNTNRIILVLLVEQPSECLPLNPTFPVLNWEERDCWQPQQ